MNDTGSVLLTLVTTDFPRLGDIQGDASQLAPTGVRDTSGSIAFLPTVLVQVQLVRDDNTLWGDWIHERVIVRQSDPNLAQLPGVGIRHAFYIDTAPSNHLLTVSATMDGLTSLLQKYFSPSSLLSPSSIPDYQSVF
jgi:hypothetical protein